MATIKAFIRTSTKAKDFVNVRFRLTDGRSVQLFHKSDIKVNPNDFDTKNETIKAKIVFDAKARKEFNKAIASRKDLISELYLNATDKSTLTSDWLEGNKQVDKKVIILTGINKFAIFGVILDTRAHTTPHTGMRLRIHTVMSGTNLREIH